MPVLLGREQKKGMCRTYCHFRFSQQGEQEDTKSVVEYLKARLDTMEEKLSKQTQ